MTYTIIFVLLAATVLIILSGLRASKGVTSLQEYFSFGDSADPSTLQRAFTVTNASFTTSFVTLFFLGLTLDRRHGPLLFDSLQRDFLAFRRSLRHGCSASSVFSIPLSDAGIDYLRRRNYTSEPARYRGKYPILRLLPQQCSSGLWKVVFATDG